MKNSHKLALISIARAFIDNTQRAGLYKITDTKYNKYIDNTKYEYYVYNRNTLILDKFKALDYVKSDIFESWCNVAGYEVATIRRILENEKVDKDILLEACKAIITDSINKLECTTSKSYFKRVGAALSFLYSTYDIKDVCVHYYEYFNNIDNANIKTDLYYAIQVYNLLSDIKMQDEITTSIRKSIIIVDEFIKISKFNQIQ